MKEAFTSSAGLNKEQLAEAMEKWWGPYRRWGRWGRWGRYRRWRYLAEEKADASEAEQVPDDAAALLHDVDVDGDGKAQLKEVVSFLSRERGVGSEKEMKEAFTAAGQDSSAGLNKEQLAEAMEKWWGGGGVHYGSASWGHGPFGGGYGHVRYGGARWGHAGWYR